MTCPQCKGTDVRTSQRGLWWDQVLSCFGQVAYRCRACRARFHSREDTNHTGKHAHRRRIKFDSRLKMQALLFGVMLIMFLLFLRYLTREPAGDTPDTSQLNRHSSVAT